MSSHHPLPRPQPHLSSGPQPTHSRSQPAPHPHPHQPHSPQPSFPSNQYRIQSQGQGQGQGINDAYRSNTPRQPHHDQHRHSDNDGFGDELQRGKRDVGREWESSRSVGGARGGESVGRGGGVADDVNREFERLLDQYQVPSSIRAKLTPLDTPIKQSMLLSSKSQLQSQFLFSSMPATSNPNPNAHPRPGNGQGKTKASSPLKESRGIRKTQSTSSLGSPVGGLSPIGSRNKSGVIGMNTPTRSRTGSTDENALNGVSLALSQSFESGSGSGPFIGRGNSPAPSGNGSTTSEYVENNRFIMLTGKNKNKNKEKDQRGQQGSKLNLGMGLRNKASTSTMNTMHSGSSGETGGAGSGSASDSQSHSHSHSRPRISAFNLKNPSKHAKRLTHDGLPLPPPLPGDSFPDEILDAGLLDSSDNGGKGTGTGREKRMKRSSFDFSGMRERGGALLGKMSRGPEGIKIGGGSTTAGQVVNGGGGGGRARAKSRSGSTAPTGVDGMPAGLGQSVSGGGAGGKKETPLEWARWLAHGAGETGEMDVGRVKKLRMLLRHESTPWMEAFIEGKGYEGLLKRLDDLLTVEWREEQHDDQLLNEILRCIKALATAEVGKIALRRHGASPFSELVDLMYSEKKPGEIPTRRLIIELLQYLLEIYPDASKSTKAAEGNVAVLARMTSEMSLRDVVNTADAHNQDIEVPDNQPHISLFLKSLLQVKSPEETLRDKFQPPAFDRNGSRILCAATELPSPKLDLHDFVKKAHRDRVYKVWLGEINDVCRDYFWVMCHSENGLWELAEVDPATIRLQAPSGATGGVEFEAMDYLTTHIQLLDALARSLFERDLEDEDVRRDTKKGEAWMFFQDLMASGLDRTLVTIRKASVEFYPQFHLEVARLLRLAADIGFQLPYPIKRLMCPPIEKYRKRENALSHYEAYAVAGGNTRNGGQSNLDVANEDVARRRQWEKPMDAGNYEFQT